MKRILICLIILLSFSKLQSQDFENYPKAMPSVMIGISRTAVDSTEFGMLDLSFEANSHIGYGLYASFEILYNIGFANLDNYQAVSFIPNLKINLRDMLGLDLGIGAGAGYSGVNFDGGQDIGIISQMLFDIKYKNYGLTGGFRIINNDYYNLKTSFVGFRYTFELYK